MLVFNWPYKIGILIEWATKIQQLSQNIYHIYKTRCAKSTLSL